MNPIISELQRTRKAKKLSQAEVKSQTTQLTRHSDHRRNHRANTERLASTEI